jgi:hypothetical protein
LNKHPYLPLFLRRERVVVGDAAANCDERSTAKQERANPPLTTWIDILPETTSTTTEKYVPRLKTKESPVRQHLHENDGEK